MADPECSTGKSPAFQFYPKDFLTDEEQASMTIAEAGVYIRLLCACWNHGSLPADLSRLAKLAGATLAEMRRCWPAVSVKFLPHPMEDGRLINPRLEREREKQHGFRRRQSDNGKRGGRPKKPNETQPFSETSPSEKAWVSPEKAKKSSSSSSADSSPEVRKDRVLPVAARALDPSDDPELSKRAGDFCDRYAEMHQRFRKGARYVSKPNLDFLEALQLVQVWDDDRLDLLAQAFLTTDDEWVASGSRTLARFRSRASWCDDKLRERGL